VVRELALEQVLFVGERDEARAASRALEKRGIEVGKAQV
jgi:hypothetical protein